MLITIGELKNSALEIDKVMGVLEGLNYQAKGQD
jgi:hypothetical protein